MLMTGRRVWTVIVCAVIVCAMRVVMPGGGSLSPARGCSGARRFHPAFGIEQERARGDDALARGQALAAFHRVAEAPTGLHLAGLEDPVTALDEHRFLEPG